jgi:hypothetical protein
MRVEGNTGKCAGGKQVGGGNVETVEILNLYVILVYSITNK